MSAAAILAPTPDSAASLLAVAVRRLRGAGIDTAVLDAKILLLHALDVNREAFARDPDQPVGGAASARFAALVARRAAREPVNRLTGVREFWSLPFALSPDTLVPRPDSEILIEVALAALPRRDESLRVLDLGTGSGCLLLALLSELPYAWGLGVDRSEAALRVAARNARALYNQTRAVFLCTDWCSGVAGRFDIVLANPPYLRTGDIASLDPEVAMHEPLRALDGGSDGLDAYRRIVPCLDGVLAPGGHAILEVGMDQADDVAALVGANGLDVARVGFDLGGRPRCLLIGRA